MNSSVGMHSFSSTCFSALMVLTAITITDTTIAITRKSNLDIFFLVVLFAYVKDRLVINSISVTELVVVGYEN